MRRPILQALFITSAALPAFAFLLGGIAKLHDPFLTAQFMARAFTVPLDVAFPVTRAVAVGELIVAAGLCLLNGRTRLGPFAGLCLLAFFVGLLVNVARSDPQAASCGCFGSLMGDSLRRSLWTQVWIDLVLALFLVLNLLLTGTALRGQQNRRGATEATPREALAERSAAQHVQRE